MNDVVLSDAMSRYLTMLSGELQLLSRGAELRRFRRGCYTLAHDDEPESKEVQRRCRPPWSSLTRFLPVAYLGWTRRHLVSRRRQ